MCTKICNYQYKLKDAAVLLNEQFTYINIYQITMIYNHHQHVAFWEILEQLDLLFYIIQKASEDNRVIEATIVTDSRKTSTKIIWNKIKEITKKYSEGKYKIYIHI